MMELMLVIEDVIMMLVLCLVLFYDKNEIIKIVEDIDIYDLLILFYEDCCIVFMLFLLKIKLNLKWVCLYEVCLDVEGLM